MKTRWSINLFSSAATFRFVGLLGFAVFTVTMPPTAARAQGIVQTGRDTAPAEPAMRANTASSPLPTVFNAATVPVSVLDKTLALRADQRAAIARLQDALQTKRQSVFALRSAPRQAVSVGANTEQNSSATANIAVPTNAANAGGAPENNGVRAQSAADSTVAAETAAQAEEAFLRWQAAEQSLARDEQATVRKVRALLTTDQIARLKTTESDALLFDSLDLPVELLGQITLSPDERANVTTIFKTARRQFLRAERQEGRDAIQNDALAQALAALSPQNKAVATAYLKAHPAATVAQ